MAHFYRAARLHREFRAIEIRAEPTLMRKDYERMLALLQRAQTRYNETIAAKHMYWVSAAGYQLGSLIAEFYDAIMGAPVPQDLDAPRRAERP